MVWLFAEFGLMTYQSFLVAGTNHSSLATMRKWHLSVCLTGTQVSVLLLPSVDRLFHVHTAKQESRLLHM